MFRIGLGQDSHRFFDNGKPLILGGVVLDGEMGLAANSDGDVIIHALCNAIEQALGGDSFSIYADKMCKKGIVDSREYLKIARKHLEEAGYRIGNLGISIEAKRPKILPLAEEIRNSLARILAIEKSQIGINATSGEELTAFGRGEGIQSWAVIMLLKENF